MTQDPDFLFVYGTLQPDFDNPFALYLRQRGNYAGNARFPGVLFNLGAYPGAIYLPDARSSVVGTMYDISRDKRATLAYLDAYEGIDGSGDQPDEYVRIVVPVCRGNDLIDCWVYVYSWPTDGKQVIASGNYSQYILQWG